MSHQPTVTRSPATRISGYTTVGSHTQAVTDRFTVDGRQNQVNPDDIDKAVEAYDNGSSSASRLGQELTNKSSFGMTLEPGARYEINASGTVDQMNNWFGGNRTPGSRDDGKTALQLLVSNQDGEVVRSMDYRPGMEIDASDYPTGSRLHAVMQEDGNRYNNEGSFKLDITRVENKTIDEGRSTRDEIEAQRRGAIDRDLPEGSIPSPRADLSRMPIDRALAVDRENGAIVTHGGYEIQPGRDSVTVLTPGAKEGTTFNFKDGRWVESDGTQAKIDDIVKDGNFIFGDGTTMAFNTDDDGAISGLTVASDRARVDVTGLQEDRRPSISAVRDDGLEWRVKRFEDTERTNFYQAGIGDAAEGTADSDKITGWYGTYKGEQLGWVEGVWDNGRYRNRVDEEVPAIVDQSLRPPLGTDSYEKALNNIFYEELGTTSGTIRDRARSMGYRVDPTEAREAALDYMQPRLRQIGEANLLNQMERDYPGLYMEQMYGGTPRYYPSMPQAYQAMAQLQALLQMQAMWAQMAPPQMLYG